MQVNISSLDLVRAINEGRLAEVKTKITALLKTDKDNHVLLHLLGLVYFKNNQPRKAVECIKKAIKYSPTIGEYHKNLSTSLLAIGKRKSAIFSLKKAIYLDNHDIAAFKILGKVFIEDGLYKDSIKYYKIGINQNPTCIDLYNDLGIALLQSNQKEKAIEILDKALSVDSNNENILINLGNLYQENNTFDKAVLCFQKAIKINDNNYIAYNNLGNVFSRMRDHRKAIKYYKQSIIINPNFKFPYNGIGKIYAEINNYKEAVSFFNKAINLDKNYQMAHANLASVYLSNGKFDVGWKEYEWREIFQSIENKNLKSKLWNGQSLENRVVFIYAEQGVGDEVMFSSCITDVLELNPKKIVLECDYRLSKLFLRSFPEICIIDRGGNIKEESGVDYHIPIGSLPSFFRNSIGDFTGEKYLTPSSELLQKWVDRYLEIEKGLKVGISWNSSKSKRYLSQDRSINIQQLEPILKTKDVCFINLQYGDCTNDIDFIKNNFGVDIYDWEDSDPLFNIDDFIAKISALDLVISVDNSTVHFAGSIGKKTFMLTPYISDWRWLNENNNSHWYSCVEFVRQDKHGDWRPVVDTVTKKLNSIINF